VLNPEQIFSSFGIEMADIYSLTAPTTARKDSETRAAMKAYEKRKTRASQVSVLLEGAVQVATDAAAAAPHPAASATQQQQTVGAVPGDAGFRTGPLPHPFAAVPAAAPMAAQASVPVAGSAPAVTTTAAAVGRIRAAAVAGQTSTLCSPTLKREVMQALRRRDHKTRRETHASQR
jgi:hypothetical protein